MAGSSPEELETLLEDAVLLRDDAAVAALFDSGVLIIGPPDGAKLAGYVASEGAVTLTRDVAVVVGDRSVTLSRRGSDARWRLLAAVLLRQP